MIPLSKWKKKKKKVAAMREILDLAGHSLLAKKAELPKPSQPLCTNCFIAFHMLLYILPTTHMFVICCWSSSAHCKKQAAASWSGQLKQQEPRRWLRDDRSVCTQGWWFRGFSKGWKPETASTAQGAGDELLSQPVCLYSQTVRMGGQVRLGN